MNDFKAVTDGLGHIKNENLSYVLMGERNENKFENIILEKYGKDLVKTGTIYNKEKHFDVIDWISSTTMVELKSRSVKHNDFNTTMIGFNKVQLYLEEFRKGKKCVFLFAFTDGLYEWIITDENYESIGGFNAVKKREDYRMTENYTSFNPTKLHLYIPINNLTKISDIGSSKLKQPFKSQFQEGVCYLPLLRKVV
jgi:hypothetical protein